MFFLSVYALIYVLSTMRKKNRRFPSNLHHIVARNQLLNKVLEEILVKNEENQESKEVNKDEIEQPEGG